MNAEQWNRLYPVGTDVFIDDAGEQYHTRTCSEAWTLGSGDPVVALEGYSCYYLAGVTPVEPVKRCTLHRPFGQIERMPLAELLDMMAGHGVAKTASVFKNHDDQPVFAVVLLTGADIQGYLDAFDQVEKRLAASAVPEGPADDYVNAVGQFKDRLRDAMKKSSISIRGLSNKVAPSEGTLRSYLRGDTYPDLPVMIEIALALGCSPAWLAIGDSKVQVAQAAVGIVEPADHQSVGALVGDKPLRMALAETSPGSIQSLPEGTRVFAHAAPQVAEEYQKAAERFITEACCDAVDKLKELAPSQAWDSGEATAEMYIRRLRFLIHQTAPTAPAGEPNADDAARELFRPVDLPHREEAAIYRAALEQIAWYPRNANEELGYPACRSIASEAIGEADLLLANAVTPSEAPE